MSVAMGSFRSDFRRLVAAQPDRTAWVDAHGGDVWSYEALDALTDRVAAFLTARGASAERPVVAALPNSVDMLALFLGALKAGVDFAPLSPQVGARGFSTWADLVDPGLIVHGVSARPALESTDAGRTRERISITANGRFDWLPDTERPASEDDRTSRLLLSTSGTTGEPKAMAFDTDRLWSAGRAFFQHHDFLDRECRFLNLLPTSYLGGLFNLCLVPLCGGASVAVTDAFSGKSFITFWQDVERLEVNVLWLVPTVVRGLLTVDRRVRRDRSRPSLDGVRACFLGTAPIDVATKEEFESRFGIPLLENYALSETTFLTSETLGSRYRREEGSVGQVLPWVEVRCLPTTEEKGDPEAPREIAVRTPYRFLGYLQKGGEVSPLPEEDGFLRTGDLGRLRDDGTLLYEGRIREIIKKGGYLVSLRETEIVAERSPIVLEAAAVPVSHPFYGEDYVLAVRLGAGADPEEALSEVRAWLNENLANYKWPDRIVARDDFPRTASGKVRKGILAEELGGE